MEFVDYNPGIANEWDDVVYNSDDGWVFSLSTWLEMITRVWNERWIMQNCSFAIRENSRLVAVMSLHFIPAEKRLSSSGWGHGGPVISRDVSAADRHRLWQACFHHTNEIAAKEHAAIFNVMLSAINKTSLNNRWGVNPLAVAGLKDCSTHTRIIRLSDDENTLWFNLSKDARQQIKKAMSMGYTAQRRPWPEMVEDYYRVHVETYTRTNVTPHPKTYFEGIANLPRDHAVLWVGFDPGGLPVAYHNDARFDKSALYHTGCASTDHLKSGINYLLFWEAILDAKRNGCEWYESGETFIIPISGKEKGLSDFKSKFGGELHRFFKGEISYTNQEIETLKVSEEETIFQGQISTQPDPTLQSFTFKFLLRNWMRCTRDILATYFPSMTRVLQKAILGCISAPRKAKKRISTVATSIRKRIAAGYTTLTRPPFLPFIKPYWSEKEKNIGFMQTMVDLDHAEKVFIDTFRKTLALPDEALIVPTGSGRTALEVALKTLKKLYPSRNKVVIPTYGCRGNFDPIINSGLTPVLVDIGYDLLMDVEKTIRSFNDDVLACVAVHLCGKQMDVSPIIKEAHAQGIIVIEDHCQNTGGTLYYPSPHGRPGLSTYSFGMGKNMMASAGGGLVANVFQDEILCESQNLQQEDFSLAHQRFKYQYNSFYSYKKKRDIATNYNNQNYVSMNPLDALILIEQSTKLKDIIEHRQKNSREILSKLNLFPNVFHTQSPEDHIFTKLSVRLENIDLVQKFKTFMEMNNIEMENMYLPLHLRDFAKAYGFGDLRTSEAIYPLVVNIPVRPNLTSKEIIRIVTAVEKFGATHELTH